MTIGKLHKETYQQQVHLLKSQIDERFGLYITEIKKRVLEYKPNDPANTSDYKIKIDVFDIINYISKTVRNLTLTSEHIEHNRDACNYLFQKLIIWLKDWTQEEDISYEVIGGILIIRLV